MFDSYRIVLIGIVAIIWLAGCSEAPGSQHYCSIRIVDDATGNGIPAIRLESLNRASYITDSDGYIAFYEPGLMGRDLYFEIDAEGYSIESDVTGRMATTLTVEAGSEVVIKMRRNQAAERLHRLTGHGIYRESILLGHDAPLHSPLINASILGQDSNLGTLYKSKIFWVWGDTFLPSAYNGNFSVSAATSELPSNGGLDPAIGINYRYFTDDAGASRPMITLEGQGYTWFEWLLNIPDASGAERLVGKYARVGGYWQNYERGIAIFNDDTGMFERHSNSEAWLKGFAIMNHPFRARSAGASWFYLTSEFDFQRVAANLDSVADPAAYEVFTCLAEGAEYSATDPDLDRDSNGNLKFDWKRSALALNSARQSELLANGHIAQDECWIQLRDVLTNVPHKIRRGSIHWNTFRQKWILIAQGDGDYFGDVLYSEADTPIGPWAYATVVAQHDNLFYNPVHHPFFDRGDTIFFEGTYTNFWNQGIKKEYYDYNQLQYQLILSNPDAMIPSPVYLLKNGDMATSSAVRKLSMWDDVQSVAFYAFEPQLYPPTAVPIFKEFRDGNVVLSVAGSGDAFVYGIPKEESSLARVMGKWETQLKSFEAIDAYLPLVIEGGDKALRATTTSKSIDITSVSQTSQTLQVEIEQYDKRYRLTVDMSVQVPGKLIGQWVKLAGDGSDTEWKGDWQGVLLDNIWLPGNSMGLRNVDSSGSIQTNPQANTIARVWANPHGALFLDPSIVHEPLPVTANLTN